MQSVCENCSTLRLKGNRDVASSITCFETLHVSLLRSLTSADSSPKPPHNSHLGLNLFLVFMLVLVRLALLLFFLLAFVFRFLLIGLIVLPFSCGGRRGQRPNLPNIALQYFMRWLSVSRHSAIPKAYRSRLLLQARIQQQDSPLP